MESIGLTLGILLATPAGSAVFFSGLLLIVGLLIHPTALVLAVTMMVAFVTVHIENGFFMSGNGYEYGLALMAISIGLVFRGAGPNGEHGFKAEKGRYHLYVSLA